MVERKRRIAKKPTVAPGAEQWVNEQVDPEVREQVSTDSREQVTTPEPNQEKDEGKAYPHRISFDMTTAQYKRLKWASFDSEQSMNEILREAVEDWMKARDY